MEYILILLCFFAVSVVVYKIPFSTDNPMGLPVNSSVLFLITDVNTKDSVITGRLAVDGHVNKHIHPLIINILNNYKIPLIGDIKGIGTKIKNSYNLVWIEMPNKNSFETYNMFSTEGVKLN